MQIRSENLPVSSTVPALSFPSLTFAQHYTQTNLVTDMGVRPQSPIQTLRMLGD